MFRFIKLSTLYLFLSLVIVTFAYVGGHTYTYAYEGSQFEETWDIISSDPYSTLPHYDVSLWRFIFDPTNTLAQASMRTISNQEDILPPFRKLVHPNGICLRGIWQINRKNKYSGYFKTGSKALVIVRSSLALSYADSGHPRALGFAAKIFPTTDPLDPRQLKTANFFAVDDLTGTRIKHYTDGEMTNEPRISLRPHTALLAPIGAVSGITFLLADIMPGIRQLYPVSELGEENSNSNIVTPKWIKISASPYTIPIDEKDFRIEILRQIRENGKLSFQIAVADHQNILRQKNWQTIGHIDLIEAVVSESCDKRLHFHHPPFKITQ
ncbi:MAG: hypothetical protein HQK51_07990 [Oligoflexia bacterium]|nr:hypothetical protein [Oligoflexia bacterium]